MNHNLVVLDPAHGGPDGGGVLGDRVLEKDVTLAEAVKLRAALTGAGFTVLATRDADSPDPLTTDQRAETSNRTHAVACIVLHATRTASGIHVYTSALQPDAPENADEEYPAPFVPVPWERAQAGSVQQSLRLADDLRSALATRNLPVVIGKAPVRPLDNLMCPAVAIEVAPLAVEGADSTPANDSDYQQRVAVAVTAALQIWRTHADPPVAFASPAQNQPTTKPGVAPNAAARTVPPPNHPAARIQPKSDGKPSQAPSSPDTAPHPEKTVPQ
jgi:N-acetylmuramoyl-L-alanine amidase